METIKYFLNMIVTVIGYVILFSGFVIFALDGLQYLTSGRYMMALTGFAISAVCLFGVYWINEKEKK